MTANSSPSPGPMIAIVYESLFGNTRLIAETIADGIREQHMPVTVVPVAKAAALPECDVLVVGAPTHAHSLSSPASRTEAERWALNPSRHLALESGSLTTGVREWIELPPAARHGYVAFDTRVDMPRIFTGAASSAIGRRLKKHGLREVLAAESFLVDKDSHLLPDEHDRALRWGREIAATTRTLTGPSTRVHT
ncbi:hypothetical protein SRABI98_02247 [Microbacterium sp. Bi98]|uniref:flavodoxin family protein n=1 Tax=unclassified Microbacterium TaxID=2609290 RepID=UPI000AC68E93|nr:MULTISPECIES: flavodoxin domain-containing protein [unclassified Microbacterium]CAH0210986.1 hypothetical protein SRABI98_02247 [Microbacterium sp. Bi98]